ncbi:Ig-like domain-containing protein, partial [Psychromonas sp. 14N.309.X.WAT.B.A12]|uniref:Ig-like domain-containing protein n=1 Tax=Psychromonas sp. 14N.309.X.WAT.B.A12 TaxID=2998322 RepID=UPI0025B0136E
MFNNINILTQGTEGQLEANIVTNDSLSPTVLKAQDGVAYELRAVDSQLAPQQVLVSRNGSDLELRFDEFATVDTPVDAIIEGYYDLPQPPALTGISETGIYYDYVPQTGLEDALSWNLSDGFSTYQSLGYTQVASNAVPWLSVAAVGASTAGVAVAATAVASSSSDESSAEPDPSITVSQLSLDTKRPGFKGSVKDPNAEVILTIEGIDYVATNNGDGTWQLDENTVEPLDEGETTLSVTMIDEQGNADTITDTVIVDMIPVEVTIDSLVTNNTLPTLTGSINDATADIVVTLNGVDYDAVNNGDGTWTLDGDLLSELAEGEVTVNILATDSAGNNDVESTTIVIDTTAPTVSLDSLITDDPTALLTGLVDDTEASVVVTVDSIDYQAVNNGDGSWSLPDNTLTELAEGETQITVTATDSANNTETIIDSVVVNTEQVEIGTRSLVSGETKPELTGFIDNPDARVVVTIKGIKCEAKNNGDGTWTLDPDSMPVLSEGTTAYTVTSIDDAGLRISTSGTVTVDLSGPEVSVNSIITKDTTPALTGNVDDPDATVIVTVNGDDYAAINNADGTWTVSDNSLLALSEGETEVTVLATDALGNSTSSTGNITVDTIGVNVTLDALTTNEISPALSGSIDDPTATVIVTVNAVEYTAVNNGDNTWSLAADTLPDLAEGEVEVSVSASDEAGHSDSATTTIEIDTTAPVVSVDS